MRAYITAYTEKKTALTAADRRKTGNLMVRACLHSRSTLSPHLVYIYLSLHLSIYPSIYLSIHLSVYLYLSIPAGGFVG